ncbi:MAG: ATP-binding protein [Alphaproteobacteria bacterium]|nr:ATP-binding protein [Alphaproteobacteria bacterium]
MPHPPEMQNNLALSGQIRESTSSDIVIDTRLKTDERVIARVTDGIYRQPASAIRELISNAYDADATRVVVKTDAPRFERISIEDNGHGMTPEALAHMLEHIGSSAKRSAEGGLLGVTNQKDPTLSPGGRKLIGKIGIGIFSVSQLTHSFQIITKVAGDDYRTVATVALKQYNDDAPSEETHEFEAGKVKIWREKAADKETQGTTIVLTNIRTQARNTLRSREIWSAIEQSDQQRDLGAEEDQGSRIDPPKFHMGMMLLI